jgi:hypothetical protein
MLTRFLNAPTTYHLTAAKRVLRYLRGTTDYCLHFTSSSVNPSDFKLDVWTDSDWAFNRAERKSHHGYIIQLNGNIISWMSKKQDIISTSSTEAEYIAISAGVQEALWIQSLLRELLLVDVPTTVHADNQSAITIADKRKFSERTKHIDIRHHFIHSHIRNGNIVINWVSTQEQLADILTKALDRILHAGFTKQLLFTH